MNDIANAYRARYEGHTAGGRVIAEDVNAMDDAAFTDAYTKAYIAKHGAKPPDSAATPAPVEGSIDGGEVARSAGRLVGSAAEGAARSVWELGRTVRESAEFITSNPLTGFDDEMARAGLDPADVHQTRNANADPGAMPELVADKTGTEGVVSALTQFVAPFAAFNKAMAGARLFDAVGASKVGASMLRGAAASAPVDFAFIDPIENNLIDTAQRFGFESDLTNYLRADTEDASAGAALENRVKAALVNMPVGVLAEGSIGVAAKAFALTAKGVRAVKGYASGVGKNGKLRGPVVTEEMQKPLEQITNPIPRDATPAQKIKATEALTAENQPKLTEIVKGIDAALGTRSKVNVKLSERIAEKAQRPSVRAKKPWFDIEHVRDTLRSKTVVNDLGQVGKVLTTLRDSGVSFVKVDMDKVFQPDVWGWRIASVDMRMPNGQIVEHYMPLSELEQAKKAEGHKLFEKWRNKSAADIAGNLAAFQTDLARSNALYGEAFTRSLARQGLSEDAARAAFQRSLASAGVTDTKLAERSAASKAQGAQAPSTQQGLESAESTTATLPSEGSLNTNASIPATSDPSIAENRTADALDRVLGILEAQGAKIEALMNRGPKSIKVKGRDAAGLATDYEVN